MDVDTQQPGSGQPRWWADRPLAVDVLVAVVVAVVELVNLYREVVVAGYEPPLPVAAVGVWLVGMSLALVWRRRRPVVVLVAVGLASGLYGIIDLPTLNLPLLVVVFTAGTTVRATAAVAGVLTVGIGVVNLLRGTLTQLPIDLVLFGAVWLLGAHLRVRQEQARDLERRREAELWRARSQERTRLARDLHDVVSNGVGGIYLQAVGAAALLDDDPRQAHQALDRIQESARATLTELRSLLDVLRVDPGAGPSDDARDRRGATPSLGDLDQVLERVRATGATVDVDVHGDLRGLPAGVSATGYRIVQEALGNAVRHGAGGPITLRVTATDGLCIEVANTVATRPRHDGRDGWGLTGMRERVDAMGGRLDVRADDGRFLLQANLPPRDGRT